LNKALRLAVGPWSVRFRPFVFDAQPLAELGEAMSDVARPVVAEDSLDVDPLLSKPMHCALQEGRCAGGSLIREDLGVGESRPIVNGDMDELPAGPTTALAIVASDAMSDPLDAPEFLDVEVHQLTRATPLVASQRLRRRQLRQSPQTQASKPPRHRRARQLQSVRDLGAAEPISAKHHHLLLLFLTQPARDAMRSMVDPAAQPRPTLDNAAASDTPSAR